MGFSPKYSLRIKDVGLTGFALNYENRIARQWMDFDPPLELSWSRTETTDRPDELAIGLEYERQLSCPNVVPPISDQH